MTATAEEKTETTERTVGRIARVIGPVVDIEFPVDSMPEMYNLLETELDPRRRDAARSRSRSPSTSATAWSARSRCSRPTAWSAAPR